MLSRTDNPQIKVLEQSYVLSNEITIYAKTLYKEDSRGKTAIYIHGGNAGGNHTMVERPSRWMMEKGLFDKIILPDRRGAGHSSPLTQKVTFEENAKDMKDLLDAMGIEEKVTAIGMSYGGPMVLTLASIDPRIDEVILMGSSPALQPIKGFSGLLYKFNLLESMGKTFYVKNAGTLETKYPDLDILYDVKTGKELQEVLMNAIKHTSKSNVDSLIFENASTLDKNNSSIAQKVSVDIPVYQVIGDRDEMWELNIQKTHSKQIPHMKTALISDASQKDVFLRAEEFYEQLSRVLIENR